MKKRKVKKESKNHVFSKIIGQSLIVFAIATVSIVLYDMYINVDVYEEQMYNAEKISKEISTSSTDDISSMLEKASKSVVRNIKNRNK